MHVSLFYYISILYTCIWKVKKYFQTDPREVFIDRLIRMVQKSDTSDFISISLKFQKILIMKQKTRAMKQTKNKKTNQKEETE